jgi:hypothetical protein
MNERNTHLLARYDRHPLRSEVAFALEVAEKFAEGKAAIEGDKYLSPEGRIAKKGALVRSALRDIRDAGAPQIAEMKQKLASIVASIKPVGFDKTDFAHALLRAELRSALKVMQIGDRAALLLGEKSDAAFIDAVLEAPGILSGIDHQMYEQIREQRLATLFTQESFQVEAIADHLAEIEAALQISQDDVARAAGLPPREFAKLATEISAKKNAPWLKRDRDSNGNEIVIVVPLRGGPSRAASESEQREGKFYDSYEAYQADRAA